MKPKFILVTLLFITLLPALRAQEQTDTPNKKSKHSLGFNGGYSTGLGLAYRYTCNKFGVQLAGMPYLTEDRTMFNVGLTFLYKLVETEKSSLFIYQGNKYKFNKEKYMFSYEYTEMDLVNGLGLGYELLLGDRIGLNFMAGYAFSAYDYRPNSIGATGEVSLLYHF